MLGGEGCIIARTIVAALGGNAILRQGDTGTAEEQAANIRTACQSLVGIVAAGHRLVLVHGNGPQVGNILLQNEEAAATVPALPLDACGAESQGLLGYLIQREMGVALRAAGLERPVVTLLTQVLVDPDDPAFHNPTKPIGPFYTPERARRLAEQRGYVMKADARRGWRRVVASPEPRGIIEWEAIAALLHTGAVVVCCGGGGVPVWRDANGRIWGVEAVIDKDLAAQQLAADLGAQRLVILTDVAHVAIRWGRPDQVDLARTPLAQLRAYQQEGHFASGSMGPKVEAACRFVAAGGEFAAIAALEQAAAAAEGKSGTVVVPD